MVEARGRFEWNQTSALLATVINIMRDPKKSKAITPDELNPYHVKQKPKNIPKVPITVLKDLFVKN
jgi:hypothetical protein